MIAQIDEWEKESEDLYSKLKRVIEQNLQYYYGNQTDVERIQGKNSKAVENRIFMATETMIPIATSRPPDIVVEPGDQDEQSQIDAQELQDILGYHIQRVNFQQLAERWARDIVLKRFGVFKVKWEKEIDDVGLEVIDPRRIRIPRYGKTKDKLPFLIEELELSYDTSLSFFGKEKAEELMKSGKKESDNKKRKKSFAIQECWTNDMVVWRSGNLLLKKSNNPYFDFKRPERNFFDAPQKPYVIKSLFETEESIIGDTDYVQQMISVQNNINIRKRQIENISGRVANPNLLIDSDVMSEEEARQITNEEGQIIYGKDAASGTKIRYEEPGNVPQYLFQDLEFSRREFDNIWGVHSTTRGEREGRETLGGRQLLKEADLGRIDLLARQLERAIDEIGEYWTQMIKMFYNDKRAFTLMGDEGVRFIQGFSSSKVGKVRPMVKPGSTLKEDEFARRQFGLLLWQNKAIGINTLYKMIKVSNIPEALRDFKETFGQQNAGAAPPEGGMIPQ